jgi:hypothetical protein
MGYLPARGLGLGLLGLAQLVLRDLRVDHSVSEPPVWFGLAFPEGD